MNECIVGWAHTPFGKLENEDIESLIAREAIADAGLEPKDIDDIYLSHFGGGLIKERFLSSLKNPQKDYEMNECIVGWAHTPFVI